MKKETVKSISDLLYQKEKNAAEEKSIFPGTKKERQRETTAAELRNGIMEHSADADVLLWQTVIAYQNYLFRTSSGLSFSYTVKRKKNGEYSGEIIVSRKEGSKTLTRSSVILAFHKVLEKMKCTEESVQDKNSEGVLELPEYSGPKAIGQIFGISYVYSMFWTWRLIKVPDKVEKKLQGN